MQISFPYLDQNCALVPDFIGWFLHIESTLSLDLPASFSSNLSYNI